VIWYTQCSAQDFGLMDGDMNMMHGIKSEYLITESKILHVF